MRPSTSELNHQKRNWLELPSDVTANILLRIGMIDILENAQKVCTLWRKICKDPAMWRVINMEDSLKVDVGFYFLFEELFKHVIDRSQGQLDDITFVYDYNDALLRYVADRSSVLRYLKVTCRFGYQINKGLTESLMKFPLLEELSFFKVRISKETIETVGHHCPKLKTLKVNQRACKLCVGDANEKSLTSYNEIAIAIGGSLHELRHLELIGNKMSNIGLQVILDGCRHLETLDLRECFYIDLKGHRVTRCKLLAQETFVSLAQETYCIIILLIFDALHIQPVPKSVLFVMESIRKNFFNGIQGVDKKITWIKWSNVLAAKQFGGLGVSNFFALNRALLFKWVWRFLSHDNSLWCRFISAVHAPLLQPRSSCRSSTWCSILREVNVLKSKGIDLLFVESSFRRPVRGGIEFSQLEQLLEKLRLVILSNSCDRWYWDLNREGDFCVKDVRRLLDDFFLPKADVATRWIKHIPIKINIFARRVFLDRLPSKMNLLRRGIQFVDGEMWFGCLLALIWIDSLGSILFVWVPRSKVCSKKFCTSPGGVFGISGIK
nr:hypothetical protein [Tanacetum cinerariifolium]